MMGIMRRSAEAGTWIPSHNIELACSCELIVAEYRLDTTFWVLDADRHVLTHGDEPNGTDDGAALAVTKDRAELAHARMCPRQGATAEEGRGRRRASASTAGRRSSPRR